MNWNNVDLKDGSSERDSNLIDGLTFDTLLLEIHCNIKEIDIKTVSEQFEEGLRGRVREAQEVFKSNLNNIVKQAKKERARKWNYIWLIKIIGLMAYGVPVRSGAMLSQSGVMAA